MQARATPYRTGRDATPGEVLPFAGVPGQRERYTVVATQGTPGAVTAVSVIHEREGRAETRRTMSMADWQAVRDRHHKAYGTRAAAK